MIAPELSGSFRQDFARMERAFSPATLTRIMTAGARKAAVAAESVVSPYPRPSRKSLPALYTRQRKSGTTYKSKFKSLKQQRMVFHLLALGRIPYKRTGLLGRSITSDVARADAREAVIVIGSNAPHAPLVIGTPPVQAAYHRGNWRPLADDIQRGLPTITRAFEDGALDALQAALKG